MLDKINLKVKIEKDRYRSEKKRLSARLGDLQRQVKDLNIPVTLIVEGWEAAGKGTLINGLLMPMDPRTFRVYNFKKEKNEDEAFRPFLWRYWIKIPEKGQIAIFNRSYYSELLYHDKPSHRLMDQANEFEETLSQDGMVFIKVFVHISKAEQKKRFDKLLGNESTAWRVSQDDLRENEAYGVLKKRLNPGLHQTDNYFAPWYIIEGEQKDYALIKLLSIVVMRLENAIATKKNDAANIPLIQAGDMPYQSRILDSIDLDQVLDRETYQKELKAGQKKIRLLQYELYRQRLPVVLIFEGWDAGGKGGAIKRLTANLDPRGYMVYPTAAPNDTERKHHYLWRFWRDMPKDGHLGIWDRSWYGRLMVEPIEGLLSAEAFNRSYREINEFEKQMIDAGAVVLKFWLQIDQEEQAKRFEERQENPDKGWKITAEDWRNREKWDLYEMAVNKMLLKTSTRSAPWIVVEANDKYYARVKVLKEVIKKLEAHLQG